MKKKITIKSPCSQNWEKMDSTNSFDARFCQSCQKNVVDFTKKSDSEIARTLKNEQNLCGRFRKNQLNKEYNLPKDRQSWAVPSALATLLALQTACTDLSSEQLGKVAIQNTEATSCNQENTSEITGNISISNQKTDIEETEEIELGEFVEVDLPPITGEPTFEETEYLTTGMIDISEETNSIFPHWLTKGTSKIWETVGKLF